MRIETAEHIAEGLEALAKLDGRLAAVVVAAGEVPLRRRTPGYEGLAHIIVGQMVSRASADAIWARLVARTGTVTPEAVAALDEAAFREIGLSRAKQATLLGAAAACLDGALDLDHLCMLAPDEAIGRMTALRGIGPWTAEVYLLLCAGHADIFPAGDIALQNAARHAFAFEERPDQRRLAELATIWSPWRGVAARLLWAYYARAMNRAIVPV
jgi:DNA-3-methyladenine glycosylase II